MFSLPPGDIALVVGRCFLMARVQTANAVLAGNLLRMGTTKMPVRHGTARVSVQVADAQVIALTADRRLLVTAQDAAELLSVTPDALRKLPILRITLPQVKGVRYRRSDLEEYVRSLTTPNG
jgi:hypothetical protein